METITEIIHDVPVALSTDPSLDFMAKRLLAGLQTIPGDSIRDGYRVQMGFSNFTFRAEGEGFCRRITRGTL